MSKEFFESKEFQKDQEFKEFKAENYKTKDVNKTADETFKTSEFSDEYQNTTTKPTNILQKLLQKVTESASSYAGSIAVTATVLVATVAVMTGLLVSSPTIEILELDSGINEVTYNILLEDLDEDTNYEVKITNNLIDYQYPLVEGENKNTITDMPSGYLYTLKVVGKNGNEEITYLSTNFYTISPDKETYQIVFMDGDIVLEEKEYEYNEIPSYTKGIPTKEKDAKYSYTFIGWDSEINPVTENHIYHAVWDKTINTYTVSFIVEGETIQEEVLEYGVLPVYKGNEPTKEEIIGSTYEFVGWDQEITEVTGNIIYTAVFRKITEKYTVTFMVDNNILQEEVLEYGTLPVYKGSTPTKDATAEFTYEFIGWDKEIVEVTEDAKYVALFKEVKNTYTVSFIVEGETIQEEVLEYGVLPVYKGSTPTKDSEEGKIYTFAGWDKEIEVVTGDKVYTAVFTEEGETFTISFIVNGKIIQTEELEYGSTPVYNGDTPYMEGTDEFDYEFAGWSPTITIVTQDQTYEAIFNIVEHAFRGSINDFTSSDVEVIWGANMHTVNINTGFDSKGDSRIAYRLYLYNEEYQFEEVYTGSASMAQVMVPINLPYVEMRYEIYGIYGGIEKVFVTKTITDDSGYNDAVYFDGPVFGISTEELEYVSEDVYSFGYEVISDFPDEESINNVTIIIGYTYDDGTITYNDQTLTRRNFDVNQVVTETIELPYNVASISVSVIIEINGRYGGNVRTIYGEAILEVPTFINVNDILVDNSYGMLYLGGEYSLKGDQVIVIETMNATATEITIAETLPATTYLGDTQTYRYYVGTPNLDGLYEIIGEPVTITLESDVTGDYAFSYKNPGSILLTYNEDETYNMYINGEFSSSDPDIYWMVTLDSEYPGYSTQEQVLVIEDLPDSTYGVVYYVYKIVDGIKYSLKSVAVSGTVGEEYSYTPFYFESDDDPLMVTISMGIISGHRFSTENIYAIIKDADGVETRIDCLPEDIIYNEETLESEIIIRATNGFTSGKLYIGMNMSNVSGTEENSYETISQLVDVKGSLYKIYELEIR